MLLDMISLKSTNLRMVARLPVLIQTPVGTVDFKFNPAPISTEADRAIGLCEFIIWHPDENNKHPNERDVVKFWQWCEIDDFEQSGLVCFVRKNDLKKFYKITIALRRESNKKIKPPILSKKTLVEIYDNSVGFLLKSRSSRKIYDEFNIPFKRGVLLCGKPGCGKTLTCKWLKYLCQKHNFGCKIVTMPQYDRARTNDQIANLFTMPKNKPGIIFFDDMDVMVKDRNTSSNFELQTFLSQLDGIIPNEGVVYIFTTNYVQELDPAFVRPGRIDLFLTFKPPTESLRREFVEKTFHPNLIKIVDIDDFIKRTDEFSFAELEEVRKLLSMDFIKNGVISLEDTFSVFNGHRKEFQERAAIGFNQKIEEEEEEEELSSSRDLEEIMRQVLDDEIFS